MKINKKEYGMGGSTMEMYKSGCMLKALLKDPKQREMAKSMLQEFEEGGKVGETDEERATRQEVESSKTATAAVPSKEDLELAYSQLFSDSNNMSLDQFVERGVDAGDLKKLTDAAMGIAEKRNMDARSKTGAKAGFDQKAIASGAVMGSSYRPTESGQGEIDASASARSAAEEATLEMLRAMGLK